MPGRPKKAIEPAEIAMILAYGDKHGDKVAAAEYKVSHRTLQRYRSAIRDGKSPELAKLVTDQKRVALERCTDLLTETYEKTLRRLQDVLPQAGPREVIGAVKIVGELLISRKALLDDGDDDGQQPGADRSGPAAEGDREETTH